MPEQVCITCGNTLTSENHTNDFHECDECYAVTYAEEAMLDSLSDMELEYELHEHAQSTAHS